MLLNYTMTLSTGYSYTFVADNRDEAKLLAAARLEMLRNSGDAAARTESNRLVRTVKSVRVVKSIYENPKTFTVTGAIVRGDDEPLAGAWHARVSTPEQAVALFKDYARAHGGSGILTAVFKGKQAFLSVA